jgi:hypothetical protein
MKIKEKLRQFGILVIRFIWPGRSKGIQRIGLLVLGLGLMIGATQAGTIQKLISASIIGDGKDAVSHTAALKGGPAKNPAAITTDPAGSREQTAASGAKGKAPNIVDLITDSEDIVRGSVKKVTDGFENGVPYTEITLQVAETIRGKFGKEYIFRQFGLIAPRKMENGKTNLNVTPEGWAKYKQTEEVVLFLHKKASITGLRTTAGLGQGKIKMNGGNVESELGNAGLFENIDADQQLLNDRDKRLLATKKGAVNSESFMSFVRRAVKDKWVEGGKLRHAKK